ncbi:hypothetical protein [Enterococcus sp. DIV1420a]
MSNHLVSEEMGAQITGQATNTFKQVVKLGHIIAFYETEKNIPTITRRT